MSLMDKSVIHCGHAYNMSIRTTFKQSTIACVHLRHPLVNITESYAHATHHYLFRCRSLGLNLESHTKERIQISQVLNAFRQRAQDVGKGHRTYGQLDGPSNTCRHPPCPKSSTEE